MDGRLLQAVANLLLAMHGEPEPHMTDLTADVAKRLDAIAARIREGA